MKGHLSFDNVLTKSKEDDVLSLGVASVARLPHVAPSVWDGARVQLLRGVRALSYLKCTACSRQSKAAWKPPRREQKQRLWWGSNVERVALTVFSTIAFGQHPQRNDLHTFGSVYL